MFEIKFLVRETTGGVPIGSNSSHFVAQKAFVCTDKEYGIKQSNHPILLRKTLLFVRIRNMDLNKASIVSQPFNYSQFILRAFFLFLNESTNFGVLLICSKTR